MVPYSGPRDGGYPDRDFSIGDGEDEPVIDPYDQDPFVNAPDYEGEDREPQPYSSVAAGPPPEAFNDPRVFGSTDPEFVPSEKVYGSDDPNALPGDRVYAGEDPFAVPSETVYGRDDPNALPGERVYAGDDPFAAPAEKVYGSDDPNAVPGDRVYAGDDPFAVENPFAEPNERAVPDPNQQGSMVPFGAPPALQPNPQTMSAQPDAPVGANPFDAPQQAQPPAAEPASVTAKSVPKSAEASAPASKSSAEQNPSIVIPGPHAQAVDEDLSDISGEGDDDDDDDDDEIQQSTSVLFGGVAAAAKPSKSRAGPELASVPVIPESNRPSSRTSYASERPSSRASQRSQKSEARSVGQWELQF